MSINVDMGKLGAFAKIAVEEGHAGDTVAVMDKSGSISSGGVWHKANIFRRLVRSGAEKAQNQATRQAFLDALGAAISEDGQHLGGRVALERLKEMLGDDAGVLDGGFALDNDGKVTTNKPLTERRISLIVDKLKEHAAEGSKTDTGPRVGIRNLKGEFKYPPKMEKTPNGNSETYRKRGSLGYEFATVYAQRLATSVAEIMKKDRQEVIWQTVLDVERDGIVRFGNTVLEKNSLMGADNPKKVDIVDKAFSDHFKADSDFAYLLASISNQTLFSVGFHSMQPFEAGVFVNNGGGEQEIVISDIKDGKVSLTASRSFASERFVPNVKQMADPVDFSNGSYKEEYSINIIKLGARDKTDGANVVHVGTSSFRIEVDPIKSAIDASGESKKKVGKKSES